jgi:hypothetical protein
MCCCSASVTGSAVSAVKTIWPAVGKFGSLRAGCRPLPSVAFVLPRDVPVVVGMHICKRSSTGRMQQAYAVE